MKATFASLATWLLIPLTILVFTFAGAADLNAQYPSGWLIEQAKRKFDTNRDGILQKAEITGRLKDRFDKDSNGQLDQDEMQAAAGQFGSNIAKHLKNQKDARQTNVSVPKTLKRKTNIRYRKSGSNSWKLDIVWPKAKPKTPRPAIVFVHGGGWTVGDKGNGMWQKMPITYAEKGYVCISVNYRLTGEAPLPACVSDCKNAVRWLRANADKYHVDPKRIGAFGISAGGHLVAMLGLAGAEADLEGAGPYQEHSSAVSAVCCVAAPTNFPKWFGEEVDFTRVHAKIEGFFGDREVSTLRDIATNASPITWVKADTDSAIPFLIIHGTDDKTVPIFQGDSFAEALEAAKFDVTYLKFDGAGHGVFHQRRKETQPAVEQFFARTLELNRPQTSEDRPNED